MGDRIDRVEGRLGELEREVDDLARRLRAIEDRREPGDAPAHFLTDATRGTAAAVPAPDIPLTLSLAGRTFVVFAGAYLLRALTESGTLPGPAGITLGLIYAAVWLLLADRAAAAGQRLGAELHGAAALVIALPLLWEAGTTRQLLAPVVSAMALGAVATVSLFVAWRRSLHGLAWVVTIGTLVSGAAMLVATTAVAAYAVFFIGLGIATLWLGYDRGWYGLRWPVALVADVAVIGLTSRVLAEHTGERPATAIGAQLLLLGTYLATIAARTLVRGRTVIPFEIAQAAAALAVGLGGALAVTAATGVGGVAVGTGALLMGAGCYIVAFAFIARRQGTGVNFYFYTSFALALTIAGSQGILPRPVLAVIWGTLALLLAWLGRRFSRTTLAAHAAIFAFAASSVGGLLSASTAALLSWAPVWPTFTVSAYAVLALLAGCVIVGRPSNDARRATRLPRLVLCVLLTIGVGGSMVFLLVTWIAGSPAQAGPTLPTIRTGILAIAAVAVALAGRYERGFEFGWLMYPVLVAGAAKLLLDDIRHSPAAMLVIALALYGGALIAAPRVSGPRASARPAESPRREVVG